MISTLLDLDALGGRADEELDDLAPERDPVLAPGVEVIRVAEPWIAERELALVIETVRSGFVSSAGERVAEFEAALAKRCGTAEAVAVTCGTHALDLLLHALRVGPGDEVVVPDLTFISVGAAVARVGARPVFADVARESLNVTPESVERALTSRTRGIVAVHTFGHPCDLAGIREVTDRRGLFLLEDACEALGAEWQGRPAGSLGDAAFHSFYANKMITTGNGGAITSDHPGLVRALRHLRGYSYAPGRMFWHREMPFNVRMSAVQAALGVGQLERLDEVVARRERLAEAYAERLRGEPGLLLPSPCARGRHAYWMYTVHVDEAACGHSAGDVRRALAAEGIETRAVFAPLHAQPVLRRASAPSQGRFPNAEWAARTGINLPSGALMRPDQIDRVADALRRALRGPRRPDGPRGPG